MRYRTNLLNFVNSRRYRRLLSELPGYGDSHTGELTGFAMPRK